SLFGYIIKMPYGNIMTTWPINALGNPSDSDDKTPKDNVKNIANEIPIITSGFINEIFVEAFLIIFIVLLFCFQILKTVNSEKTITIKLERVPNNNELMKAATILFENRFS
ncbi:MAG: hypothetical protein ACRC63_00065, partial [Metamycoplasmataceae bacterium]